MKIVALILAWLLATTPAFAQQQGSLAPGASVEVTTDAGGFTSFSFWHETKAGAKTVAIEIVGPTTKQLTVEPDQKIGYAGKYDGKKVTIVNKGDLAIRYEVN